MRAALAWTFYAVGDWFSNFDWGYPIYNRLMLLSESVQGEGPGPWHPTGCPCCTHQEDENETVVRVARRATGED